MSIQGNEKLKVQKTINNIVNGDFDDRTVDSLFMGLRAHSAKHDIFREVADFVAHNDLRDKGLTNRSLEAFYLSFKYFTEYISPKISLDITKPFPIYIKKLMKYQIDKCEDNVLKDKFGVTKMRLKSRIDNLFKDNKREKTTTLKKGSISKPNYDVLKHILGFIGSKPAYTQVEIIAEILSVIRDNDLVVDELKLQDKADKIILCILALIHKSKYAINGHKHGYCEISCEKTSHPYQQRYVDPEGNEVEVDESHGKLNINGHVTVKSEKGDVTVCYPVLQTELETEDWCDNSLFVVEPLEFVGKKMMYRKVNFESFVGISDNFKLMAINI